MSSWYLLAPVFLAGMAALTLPLLLHLLKRKAPMAEYFPSLAFFQTSHPESRRAQRWRRRVVCFLRCLGLALLALAFSRPFHSEHAPEPDSLTILLWDDSASLGSGETYRLLQKKLTEELRRCSPKNPVSIGLVRGGGEVLWSGAFSGDAEKLLQWFRTTHSNQLSSDFSGVSEQTDRRFASLPAPRRRVVIFCDDSSYPWLSCGDSIRFATATSCKRISIPCRRNLLSLRSGPVTLSGNRLTVQFTAENLSPDPFPHPLKARLKTLSGDEADLDFTLDAGEEKTLSIVCELPSGHLSAGEIRVDFSGNDPFPEDNVCYFAESVPAGGMEVTRPGPEDGFDYLSLALGVNSPVDPESWDPGEGSASGRVLFWQTPDSLGQANQARLKSFVERGGVAVLLPSAGEKGRGMRRFLAEEAGITFDSRKNPRPCRTGFSLPDSRDPFLNPVLNWESFSGWLQVRFFSRYEAELPEEGGIIQSVLNFSDGRPALLRWPRGRGFFYLWLGDFRRDSSNWAMSATFLPFWRTFASGVLSRRRSSGSFEAGMTRNGETLLHTGCYQDGTEVYAVNLPEKEIRSMSLKGERPALTAGRETPRYGRPSGETSMEQSGTSPHPSSDEEPVPELFLAAAGILLLALLLANRTVL